VNIVTHCPQEHGIFVMSVPQNMRAAEDGKAAGKVSHGLEGHLRRVGVPARRVDHRGVDTALVHEAHRLLGGERGDLAMSHVAGQPAAPEMDLSIHDAHHASLPSSTAGSWPAHRSIAIESILCRLVLHLPQASTERTVINERRKVLGQPRRL
jgi:hypothetical protein